jgi:hypothetical protein
MSKKKWHVYPWIEVYEWSDMCTCGMKCTSGVTCFFSTKHAALRRKQRLVGSVIRIKCTSGVACVPCHSTRTLHSTGTHVTPLVHFNRGVTCVPVGWSVRVEWHVYPWIEVYEWSDMCTHGLKCTSGVTCVPVEWSVRVEWHVSSPLSMQH